MIGAIVGDYVGSVLEGYQLKEKKDVSFLNPDLSDFEWILKKTKSFRASQDITDDTICAMGLLKAVVEKSDPAKTLRDFCLKYADADTGFGKAFSAWLKSESLAPYGSNANGAIMRISFIPYLGLPLNAQIDLGLAVTNISHDNDDARQAVVMLLELYESLKFESLFINKQQKLKTWCATRAIKSLADYHAEKKFEMHSIRTLEQAVRAVADASSFEEVLINCMFIGGDVDTLCCIAGGLAQNVFTIPEYLKSAVAPKLTAEMHELMAKAHIAK